MEKYLRDHCPGISATSDDRCAENRANMSTAWSTHKHRQKYCRHKKAFPPWTSYYFIIPVLFQFLLTYAQGQGDFMEGNLPTVEERVFFEIEEEKPEGTYVGTIPTIESLTYIFSEKPNEFKLNPVTGVITTESVIDRESLVKDTFDLFVQSEDTLQHLIEVRITVLDVNDNSPVFAQRSIEVTFSERDQPGSQIFMDTATDLDTKKFGVTTEYKILSGNEGGWFRLVLLEDTSIPLLYLENTVELDREERDLYQLRISVPDKGTPPNYGYLIVNITIRDFNDNHPVFDQSYYSVQMNETSPPGTSVIQVQATDEDMGPNGDITYSIISDDYNQFAVDPLTGVLTTTKQLMCQHACDLAASNCKPNSCFVTVEARDRGGLSGRAYITITLMDENDHDPVIAFEYFTQLPYATVDESAGKNDIVAFVMVSDQDDAINGQTTVKIVKGNELGHFKLQTGMTNVLSVIGPIDRERVSKYNLTFEAQDMGSPSRKSFNHLVILVNDINDHAPVFQQDSYYKELSELIPIGSFVASVTALDNDTGINAEISYSIISGNDRGWFIIDSGTGLVTTHAPLDREEASRIILQIQAKDGAINPFEARTNLTISIWDENDETPLFEQSLYLQALVEGASAGTEIQTVRAVDFDEGQNGTVTYSFTPETVSAYPGLLYLNQVSGRISLARELDREEFPEVLINVAASDQGTPSLSSTATIRLMVGDLNDNSPVFYPLTYYATVKENQPAQTSVVRVTATDPDALDNGTVYYRIQSGSFQKFSINIQTGVIFTRSGLDREERSLYRLNITARDGGYRTTDAIVEISVSDIQDTPPVFSQSIYTFSIIEDNSQTGDVIGRTVGVVSATTEDELGTITYAITGGDPGGIFTVDSLTGEISTARGLDRENKPFYQIHMTAIAGQNFGETLVNITVRDVNDNAPRFENSLVEASVVENWPVGHSVYVARALDPDADDNGLLRYSLTPGSSSVFSINADTAMISLASSLQYVAETEFEVRVLAHDHGSPPLSSTQTVHITLWDVNDHTPLFEHASYEVSIRESQPVNDRFARVIAHDDDKGINGEISYAITKGNGDQMFGIFPDGVLYIAQSLDRETKDMYVLSVRAVDGGVEPRSSLTNVTVRILDANDNAPHFVNDTFNFYMQEGSVTGTSVGIIAASDADDGLNAEISYKIFGESKGFKIHPKTGVISSSVVFDREDLLESTGYEDITLSIQADDAGTPPLQSRIQVHIYITDVNDNAPVFSQPQYEASVLEDQFILTPVIRVTAKDADSGNNAEVSYMITGGNEAGKFSIDTITGQIELALMLDREVEDEYSLTVLAVDGGSLPRNTSCQVRIVVEDTNDNVPVFSESFDNVEILETASIGDYIFRVLASDADYANNAFLTYRITGGNPGTKFRIDANNGRLYVAAPLDYEEKNLYQLNITVYDSGDPQLSSSHILPIHVMDYNDNAPEFSSSRIIRQIKEGVMVGTSVITMSATDPDQSMNGEVRYSIKRQEPAGTDFEIDPETGLIQTAKEIDRELTESYNVYVVATDQALPVATRKSAEKLVTIQIGDINDNAPKFVSMNAVPVMLGAQAGTFIMQVQTEDPDAGQNGEVTYEIFSGDNSLFRIDSLTGRVTLRSPLSSQVLTYDLTIQARDRGQNDRLGQQTTISQLTIFTRSSLDAGPQFSQTSYSSQVYENQAAGTSIVTVAASYSARPTADLEYYLTSVRADGTDQNRLFQVNPATGVVSTTEPLDLEEGHGLYEVEVYAVDRSSSAPQTRKTMVQITLLDTNDSPPLFGKSYYTFQVPENVAVGYEASQLVATDADEQGDIIYRIKEGGDNKFSLDPVTGSLQVAKKLDREVTPSYELTIIADDGQQSSSTLVTIEITDVNDEPPVFDAPNYYFDIFENAQPSSVIGQISASDGDEGDNAEITYSISSHWGREKFSLSPLDGVFTLTASLDYEEIQHYVLTVKAQDGGSTSLSSTVLVYMNVIDVNDNAPIFDQSSYSVNNVLENASIGMSVLQVSATDLDSGMNGRLQYSINPGNVIDDDFSIDPDTGVLYVQRPLDRDADPIYFLEVQATDLAPNPQDRKTGIALVTILLEDINDNAPVFETPSVIEVMEHLPAHTSVATVIATDVDTEERSYIGYYLDEAGRQIFEIDILKGTLKTVVVLDREVVSEYVVTVTARDQGNPPLSTTMSLTVIVDDWNDHNPVFQPRTYEAEINEDITLGSHILQVFATDQDIGLNAEIHYRIDQGDDNHDFYIDSHNGEISVQQKLDYEQKQVYNLVVVAQDLGSPPRSDSATVTITVNDVNDCAPLFVDSPYVVYVQENSAYLPVHVVQVLARDDDSEPFSRVLYAITSQDDDATIFQVNATTGIITAHETLDRETKDKYELLITATDSGFQPRLTGTGTVTVLVEDDNDNDPVFMYGHYSAEISENQPQGSQVLHVHATDHDTGENAQIRYSLENDVSGKFTVDPVSGVVATTMELDHEEQSIYHVVVMATDQGLLPRSTSVTLTISVLDLDDNLPQFEERNYEVYIRNPTSTGAFILGVLATDADAAENGEIGYTFLSGGDENHFSLDPDTGIITAHTQLSSSVTPGGYNFRVRATDKGQNPDADEAFVTVRFLPTTEVDFPEITSPGTSFQLAENVAINTPFTTLSAASPKPGATITYHVVGGNIAQSFSVNPVTGDLSPAKALDYETIPSYTLFVEARDDSDPPLSDVVQLSIEVTDVNDNWPTFSSPSYNASVQELGGRDDVIRVTASDKDSGLNGQVLYGIAGGNVGDKFSIDGTSGMLRTTGALDREAIDLYQLVVTAADTGSPAKTSTATVDVHVLDWNDNPPQFNAIFSAQVPENVPFGYPVIQITTDDADVFPNNVHTFSLTSQSNKFTIDSETGTITVIGTLDREAQDSVTLNVYATDGSYGISTPVSIEISDVNDNPPTFLQMNYDFDLGEDQPEGTLIGRVSATDNDSPGPNSKVYYRLKESSEFFKIDAQTGQITSRFVFTYNENTFPGGFSSGNTLQVAVLAIDGGDSPLQSEAIVFVHIKPANKNAPVFDENEYMAPVSEDAVIGQTVLQLHASDADFGQNAEIVFSITGGNGLQYLNIDPITGWLSVAKSVSGLAGQSYSLTVQAQDKGIPPLSSSVTVTLKVSEVNLYAPIFDGDVIFQVTIPENQAIDSVVATISASDQDSEQNGLVSYFITGGDPGLLFSVDESGGYLRVKRPLDYENRTVHYLNMTARDRGLLPKQTTRLFTVILTDVNDNAPYFADGIFKAQVEENSPSGTVVINLNATDADTSENSEVIYTLMDIGDTKFTINDTTGVIRSLGAIDYEQDQLYSVTVQARNPGTTLSGSTTVSISVLPVNEYIPAFSQQVYEFVVSESAGPGNSVGDVAATDQDLSEDGVVYYYLIGDSNMQGFTLDSSTGILSISNYVDREATSEIVLDVLAKNIGPIYGNDTAHAQIRVVVRDANDPPQFTQSVYQADVKEDISAGSSVIRVTAVDNDILPDDRRFEYVLLNGNADQTFQVESDSGWIYTLKTLDRESVDFYTLIVGAVDDGIPSKTGTAQVRLTITDVNDNGPYFDPAIPEGSIMEERSPFNDTIIILGEHTKDPDISPNQGPYSFSLLDQVGRDKFDVGIATGHVKARVKLDREEADEYMVRVKVTDGGSPQMSSTLSFRVLVEDTNDNPSSPRSLDVFVYAYDGRFPGGLIADVKPLDPDVTGNYQCSLVGGDTASFSIPQSCQLHSEQQQNMATYSLDVRGSDGLHSAVTYESRVQFRRFDEDTMDYSIVLKLGDTSSEIFLDNSYTNLLQALGVVFADGSDIVVFALEEKSDVQELNVFLAVQGSDGSYLPKLTLTQVITQNENNIESSSGVTIIGVNQNPCSTTPCANGAECSHDIAMSQTTSISDGKHIIFTSPTVRQRVQCECPEGYEGEKCDIAVNQCENNPCENGGSCVNQGGGQYICSCPPSWTGTHCEEDVNECYVAAPCLNGGSCHNTGGSYECQCPPQYTGHHCELLLNPCSSKPCQNNGVCQGDGSGGYTCDCLFGDRGRHCEVSSLGFESLSYQQHKLTLDDQHNVITAELSSTRENALLLYYPASDSDFLALEVVSGNVVFSYRLGEEPISTVIVQRYVSDGGWWRIEADRNGKNGTLRVSKCQESEHQCDLCLPSDNSCYQQTNGAKYQILDLEDDMVYVGGVDDISTLLESPGRVSSHDFTGCLREMFVDGANVLELTPLAGTGVSDMCPRTEEGVCQEDGSAVCQNEGVCTDEWDSFRCKCKDGFTGLECDQAVTSFSFTSGSVVMYKQHESYVRDQLLNGISRRKRRATNSHVISLSFITKEKEGVLFYSKGSDGYMQIYLMNGKVGYQSLKTGDASEKTLTTDLDVSNSKAHNVTVQTAGMTVSLKVDDEVESLSAGSDLYDPLGLSLEALTLGGVPDALTVDGAFTQDFNGCLDEFLVDGEKMPLDGATERFDITPGGDVGYSCPLVAASGLPVHIAVIVVVVFFVIALIIVLIVFFVIRRRRQKAKEQSGTSVKQNGNMSSKSNTNVLDKSSNDGNNGQDSGFGDHPDLSEEDIIRQHIQDELGTNNRSSSRATRPDLVVPDITAMSVRSGEVVLENGGVFNEGYNEEPPEHYDIDNASSIAPSDLVDVVAHYKRYRSGMLHEQHNRNHHHHKQPRSSGLPPSSAYPHHNHPHSSRHRTSSPGMHLDRTHDSLTSVSRQSPLSLSSQRSLSPTGRGLHNHPVNNLNRHSPLSHGIHSQGPVSSNIPGARPAEPSSLRSTPLSGISGLYPHSTSSTYSERPQLPNGHVASRPNSRVRQPITHLGPRGTPTVGLNLDEIHRLNNHIKTSPSTMDALSSSSGSPIDNKINRTDFTHADLLDPASLMPPESSSEESANDSFTCSEFEYDNDRMRNDFSNPHRLVPRLTRVNEDEDTDSTHQKYSSHVPSDSNRDDSFSTFFTSDDELSTGKVGSKKLPQKALNLEYLLNWGPNFEKLVGVFEDIAHLPDSGGGRSSRPSSRGSPKPTSPFKPPTPSSPMPVIPEDHNTIPRQNGYDSHDMDGINFNNRASEEYV